MYMKKRGGGGSRLLGPEREREGGGVFWKGWAFVLNRKIVKLTENGEGRGASVDGGLKGLYYTHNTVGGEADNTAKDYSLTKPLVFFSLFGSHTCINSRNRRDFYGDMSSPAPPRMLR